MTHANKDDDAERGAAHSATNVSEPTNFPAARAFVDFGLSEQRKGNRESASGPGSSLAASAQCRELLDEITSTSRVTKILDLGCGDWNWMKEAHWYRSEAPIEYMGWEANPELVSQLESRFGRPGISFHLKDIVTEDFPAADLLICRDVLFHLPSDLAVRVVDKARCSGGLLLTTTFPTQPENADIRPYLPIPNWGFYLINLDLPPFDLAPWRIRQVFEATHSGDIPRAVAIYDFRKAATI